MSQKNTCYVTTPIYYVTARPHVGSLYSTLIADVLTRWHKLRGYQTFLLTGTDEHGQKVAQAAAQAGMAPKKFVDGFIDSYKDAWKTFEIDYSYFIRTTDTDHIRAVQYWLKQLIDQGDIYKAQYEGWYCTPCETFITETEVQEQRMAGNALSCVSCERAVEQVKEETYFFRLSAYQDRLLQFYEDHPEFIVPQERSHEVINFVRSGLKDLSISRRTVIWGIPFPDDDQHVTYVWADALNNYITAIGYGRKDRQEEFNRWWPATFQVLGKDIIRFHAIYWPAFLMASGLDLPKHLLVHGWIQVDKKKMSKSLGNVVDPMALYQHYGADPVRYYLMRYMAITQDSNFSTGDLEQLITSDLANDLGNLLNRMICLAEKHGLHEVTDPQVWSDHALQIIDESLNLIADYDAYMQDGLFHMALGCAWKFIHQVNAYFHAQEPWKLAATKKDAFAEVLAVTCHSLHIIATLLWPIMPNKMVTLLHSLGVSFAPQEAHDLIAHLELSWKARSFMLTKVPELFKKYEAKEPAQSEAQEAEQPNYITIDDVVKVHLAAGTVEQCEDMVKSDKLYKLYIDFGPHGKRQILAGIKQSYAKEDLIGKQVICVINLKPRMMLGLESQGMLLVVHTSDKKARIITPIEPVPNGTKVQ